MALFLALEFGVLDLGLADAAGERVGALEAFGREPPGAESSFFADQPLSFLGVLFQPRCEASIERDVEQLPQDAHALRGLCGKERLEPALRQEHDLAELLRSIAEQILRPPSRPSGPSSRLGYIPPPRVADLVHRDPGRIEKEGLVDLECLAGTHVVWGASGRDDGG